MKDYLNEPVVDSITLGINGIEHRDKNGDLISVTPYSGDSKALQDVRRAILKPGVRV